MKFAFIFHRLLTCACKDLYRPLRVFGCGHLIHLYSGLLRRFNSVERCCTLHSWRWVLICRVIDTRAVPPGIHGFQVCEWLPSLRVAVRILQIATRSMTCLLNGNAAGLLLARRKLQRAKACGPVSVPQSNKRLAVGSVLEYYCP